MSDRAERAVPEAYDLSVFINCPFDQAYSSMLRALIFAVLQCGLRPRCALEVHDSGEVRLEKILRIIGDCRWGIHDISRTEQNEKNLPRFNMPLELGLFLGAGRFGAGRQTKKSCLILDREPYRYQAFISDLAGQDISAHHDEPDRAIAAIRHWFASSKAGFDYPPGGKAIGERYARFCLELPRICSAAQLDPGEMTFIELVDATATWLKRETSRSTTASASE